MWEEFFSLVFRMYCEVGFTTVKVEVPVQTSNECLVTSNESYMTCY